MSHIPYAISYESISIEDLINHFAESADDFAPLTAEERIQYAHKLANNANFVTIRLLDGSLGGIVAYYANQVPKAFISHVWIKNELRGNNICANVIDNLSFKLLHEGFESMALEVKSGNFSAIKAYKKSGFEFVNTSSNNGLMHKKL